MHPIKGRLFGAMQKPPLGSEVDWGHPLAKGLVGCWLFNEGAGRRAMDLCATPCHARLYSGAAWAPGPRGVGLSLDGNNDYAEAPAATKLDLGRRVSVVCGFTQRALGNTWGGLVTHIAKADPYDGYWLGISGNGRLRGFVGPYNTSAQDTVSPIPLGRPVAAALVSDGTVHAMYVDGRQASVPKAVGSITATDVTLRVGRSASATEVFPGTVDRVSVHTSALTTDQIRWLAAEPYCMIRYAGPLRRYFIPVWLSVLDSVAVGAIEGSAVQEGIAASDGVSMGVEEGAAHLSGAVIAMDSVAAGVDEGAVAVAGSTTASDAVSVAVVEMPTVSGAVSASDSVAAALMDHLRGEIMGVQEQYTMRALGSRIAMGLSGVAELYEGEQRWVGGQVTQRGGGAFILSSPEYRILSASRTLLVDWAPARWNPTSQVLDGLFDSTSSLLRAPGSYYVQFRALVGSELYEDEIRVDLKEWGP